MDRHLTPDKIIWKLVSFVFLVGYMNCVDEVNLVVGICILLLAILS